MTVRIIIKAANKWPVVIVKAMHNWSVDVSSKDPITGAMSRLERVEPGTERTFYVHSAADLLVHEVQPDEAKTPAE